jgi:hypothetical protein
MNNFELHEQAKKVADSRTAYHLARELLQLQEQMASAVAAVHASATKPPLNSYAKKVLRKKLNKLERLHVCELECLELTKLEMTPPQSAEMMDSLASVADAQSRTALRLEKKISHLLEAINNG